MKVLRNSISFQMIKRHESENYSWTLFLNPMNQYLWIMLGLHSIFLAVILQLFWCYFKKNVRSNSEQMEEVPPFHKQVQHHITMCSSYLGQSCGAMPYDDKSAIKEGKLRGCQATYFNLSRRGYFM